MDHGLTLNHSSGPKGKYKISYKSFQNKHINFPQNDTNSVFSIVSNNTFWKNETKNMDGSDLIVVKPHTHIRMTKS